MRDLTFCEVNTISGGMNCFDAEVMAKVKAKVIKDGTIVSVLSTAVVTGIVWGATNNYLHTGIAAAIILPYTAALGIFTSSGWSNPVA